MRNRMNRMVIVVSALLPLAGCGLLPDAYSGCDKVQPYQAAQQVAPLDVPAGADLPDTRNALKIPEITDAAGSRGARQVPRAPAELRLGPPARRVNGPRLPH